MATAAARSLNVSVIEAGGTERAGWDAFIDAQEASPLAAFGVTDALTDIYPVTPVRLMARREDGTACGVLLAYHRRGGVMFSPPGGLVAEGDGARDLLRAARAHAEKHGLAATALSAGERPLDDSYFRWTKTTVVKPLAATPDALWDGLRKKTRYTIRRAGQLGVEARWGLEYLPEFHAAYSTRMAEKRLPFHPQGFFEGLARHTGRVRLVVAFEGARAVGGMVFLFGRSRALYQFNATYGADLALGANHLMMWEAMKRCAEEGISTLDLGESTPGGGVYHFKTLQFGGEPRDVHYCDVLRAPGAARESAMPAPFAYRLRARIAPLLPIALRAGVLAANKEFERLI